MTNQNEKIKMLIEHDFRLELISFELDIPMEQVIKCQEEIKKSKASVTANTYSSKEVIKKLSTQAHARMEKMRKRYRQLYWGNSLFLTDKPRELSTEESEMVKSVLDAIEEKIEKMSELSRKERRKCAERILEEIKPIMDFPLSVEQCEKLYYLIQSEKLRDLNLIATDRFDLVRERYKSTIVEKLMNAIETRAVETDEISELQALNKKITLQMIETDRLVVTPIANQIGRKISKLQQQLAIKKANEIPENIQAIIRELANATLDIQKANSVIDEEAKRRAESRPKSKFGLTQEQERRQVLIQISTAIKDRANEYGINNPEATVLQLQELMGGDKEQTVRIVVQNLIAQKRYQEAKLMCERISSKYNKDMTSINKEITKAEIADCVLDALEMKGNNEEERIQLSLIERRMKEGNIKPDALFLVKSKDGLRNITLADIYEPEKQK